MFYGLTELVLTYFIISIPVSLFSEAVFKIFKNKFDLYSPAQKSHWLFLIAFAPLAIIICLAYNLQEPGFVSFCKLQHEFCLGLVTTEKLAEIKLLDSGLLLSVLALFSLRAVKVFKFKSQNIPLISSHIYKEKLETYLSTKEINKIQILDTNDIYAYCKGFFKPAIYLSRGLIESLTHEQLHIVILHEKAHIKRGDLLVSGLFNLFSVISVYPNLLSDYFSLWKTEKEKACDDEVVKVYSPLIVAQTIIEVLKKSKASPAMASGFACKNNALKRVERLTKYQLNTKEGNSYILCWALLFISIISLFQFPLIHCSLDNLFLLFIELF